MTDPHTRPDGRVAIHIEHPDHDGGVRCFYRFHDMAVDAIRSHLQGLDGVTRVDITDELGLGLSERALLGERDVVAATGVEAEG